MPAKVIICYCLLTLFGCAASIGKLSKPNWVKQRPVYDEYYTGVGIALKKSNPHNYQTLAKNEALTDLVSEISVQVNSSSYLQQLQQNADFKQQFESEVKLSTMNYLTNYEVVDSWENEEYFWIYIRKNKKSYQTQYQKQLYEAAQRALFLYEAALTSEKKGAYTQALSNKINALQSIQQFMHEYIAGSALNPTVSLQTEILSSIETQLQQIKFICEVPEIRGKFGKSQNEEVTVLVVNQQDSLQAPVCFLPFELSKQNDILFYQNELTTNAQGKLPIRIKQFQSNQPYSQVSAKLNLLKLASYELNHTLKQLLQNIPAPAYKINLYTEPITIMLLSTESNLNNELKNLPLGIYTKQHLTQKGCRFVIQPNEADYILQIHSNTEPRGSIWGNMLISELNATITLTETKQQHQVFTAQLKNLNGYQTTPEKAGLEAYKVAQEHLTQKVIPELMLEIFNSK